MKLIGPIAVLLMALTLHAQSDQPAKLSSGDAAPVRILPKLVHGLPCGSPSQSKENEKLSRREPLCGPPISPLYPPEARKQRIQGTVHLKAVIGKDGLIKGIQVIDGHPMLIAAAMDAVKSWRYKPYRIKGKIVEVETVITVNYSISDQEP